MDGINATDDSRSQRYRQYADDNDALYAYRAIYKSWLGPLTLVICIIGIILIVLAVVYEISQLKTAGIVITAVAGGLSLLWAIFIYKIWDYETYNDGIVRYTNGKLNNDGYPDVDDNRKRRIREEREKESMANIDKLPMDINENLV